MPISVKKLTPDDRIHGLDDLTVGDFWSWAYSDVLVNTIRPFFAEFLVASALGVTDTPRIEWDAVDLRYRGKTIEVKSSARIQSWWQRSLSRIGFGIAKKRSWDSETNTLAPEPVRASDCYVFCLYPETDPARANILDVRAWQFFVLATELINRVFGDQKSLGLQRLKILCPPLEYEQLRQEIDRVLGLSPCRQADPARMLTE